MIIFQDVNSTGMAHCAFNQLMLKLLLQADPEVCFIADQQHLEHVTKDKQLAQIDCLADRSGQKSHSIGDLFRTSWQQLKLLRQALKRHSNASVIIAYPSPMTLWFINFWGTLNRHAPPIHLLFHGNISNLEISYRSKVWRYFSFKQQLNILQRSNVDALVLEPHIKTAVCEHLANTLHHKVNVFEHPVQQLPNQLKPAVQPNKPPQSKMTIGFFGVTSDEKGFQTYSSLAKRLHQTIDFWVIGQGNNHNQAPFAFGPANQQLPYDEYLQRLAQVDLVFFCQLGSYYNFAASGTFLDFVLQDKLLVGLRSAQINTLEAQLGPIGWFYDNEQELESALTDSNLLEDQVKVQQIKQNLTQLKQQRSNQASIIRLKQLIGSKSG